ncbi:MAG TPA: hypothetical protein VKO83_05680 [Steroidobacteraceae bacterium]|nr:hypothetical protein [Steroidobacteraceae bacterium]
MKRMLVIGATLLALLLVATLGGGDPGYWQRYFQALAGTSPDRIARSVAPRIAVPGQPGAMPRAAADSESIATEALDEATKRFSALGARALIVHRHGHRILQLFDTRTSGATELTGGELTPAVFALSLAPLVDTRRVAIDAAVAAVREESAYYGTAGWRNPWSGAAHRRFRMRPAPALLLRDAEGGAAQAISQRVWQPLQAQDAALWGQGDQALRVDYNMVAKLDDWVRVGDVLLQQGNFAGERIASPDWIRALLAADLNGVRHPVWLETQQAWTGAEPPAARDALWFDLGAGVRLWLVPRRGLSVLLWSASRQGARDTEMPNLFIRALTDQAPPVGAASAIDQIVPGH